MEDDLFEKIPIVTSPDMQIVMPKMSKAASFSLNIKYEAVALTAAVAIRVMEIMPWL